MAEGEVPSLYRTLEALLSPLIDRPSGYAFYHGGNENDGKGGHHRGVDLFIYRSTNKRLLQSIIMAPAAEGDEQQNNPVDREDEPRTRGGGYPEKYFNEVSAREVTADVENWVHEDGDFDEAQRDSVINALQDLCSEHSDGFKFAKPDPDNDEYGGMCTYIVGVGLFVPSSGSSDQTDAEEIFAVGWLEDSVVWTG